MMQSSANAVPQPEAMLEWLQKEMGYRPQGQYINNAVPSAESLRRMCRGNMVPVFNFLLKRVKSEKTVEKIRRNILVHGSSESASAEADEGRGGKGKRKDKEKSKLGSDKGSAGAEGSAESSKEIALRERDAAEKEVQRLRAAVQRQRKELRAKMIEASREEAERKRMLDERANYRHKQVMLEAYSQQCTEAAKIFAEYQKRLHNFVNQARDAQKSGTIDRESDFNGSTEKEAVYSTVKGNKLSDDVVLIETTRERSIRKACEALAEQMIERIRNTFPAYEGIGIHQDAQLEAAKLGIDYFDGDIPEDVKSVIVNSLRNPPQLLHSMTAYTSRMKTIIHKETEKIDIRADAERLRYKYENNRVTDVASPDVSSSLQYLMYGSGKIGADVPTKGTYNQLLERQKAHVQQFVATEDALNKAAEARELSQMLIKRLHGSSDISSNSLVTVGNSHNMGSLKHFELDVWAKEREAAGLRASVTTLMSEVQRLKKLCAEWKEAEESLRKKWKKIEEFDARRTELELIYTALLRSNTDAAAFWNQQPLAAREYASTTIVPACAVVVEIATNSRDLIDKEVSAFSQSPDNSLFMLPSTPQALVESMAIGGATGPEAVATAEKHAALLTARAGARDPSAIPSICRVSAALQYHAGLEGSDAALASVLGSLEFCLKLRGSEASVLEDLWKAINLVHIRRNLVESGHGLLNHAHRVQLEYERTTSYCLSLAAEQERVVMERWVPELKNAYVDAQKCLEDCKRVRGLVDEWWEQPAATIVDWVTVDGKNVAAWLNHVKQLQMAFYDKELL